MMKAKIAEERGENVQINAQKRLDNVQMINAQERLDNVQINAQERGWIMYR